MARKKSLSKNRPPYPPTPTRTPRQNPIICSCEVHMSVKEYSKENKMTLASTCKATLERAMDWLPEESKQKVKLVDANAPIFEGVKSRELRALMMVACGCDVYKPGIVGIGPTLLKKTILDPLKESMEEKDSDNEDMFYHKLLKKVAKKTRLGVDVIETLVAGIIYEPTNYVSCDGTADAIITEDDHVYFSGAPPSRLPEYLSDFAHSKTIIDNGPSISRCKGVGDRSHLFLSRTGWKRCHGCNVVVCGYCSDCMNDNVFCLHCFAGESLVPSRDGGFTSRCVIVASSPCIVVVFTF